MRVVVSLFFIVFQAVLISMAVYLVWDMFKERKKNKKDITPEEVICFIKKKDEGD